MPLKNGTQKDLKLGPDFRRDDDDDKGRDDDKGCDDDYRWVELELYC